jgi:hypothetical protein
MPKSNLYMLGRPLQPDQLSKERDHSATWQPSVGRSKAETEPGQRLWKICAEAPSERWPTAFTELLKFAGS